MILESKKYREDRQEALNSARSIIELAEKEGKDLTPEQDAEYTKHIGDVADLDKKIKRVEKLNELNAEAEEKLLQKATEENKSVDEIKDTKKEQSKVFWKYMRKGIAGLTSEERSIFETRAQSEGTDSEGGYLVPDEFSGDLEKALKAYGGMRSVARVIRTGTGQTLDWPTVNSTAIQGEWLAENATAAEQDETFANVQLSSYTASSKIVKVSRQLMSDSFFNLEEYLSMALAERIGRLTNVGYTTGNGASKPRGVKHDATSTLAASASAITFDEIIDLKHEVDPAYRANGTWMFNDSTLKAIAQLKDTTNQYLWRPSVSMSDPDLLLGHPIVINQDVESIGAGNYPVLFGDFSKYIIRDVEGFTLLRLNERYADALQVGFIGFLRTDGKVIDAGTNPIKAIRNPST